MSIRSTSFLVLAAALAVSACDSADANPPLPDAKGEQAPPREAIPVATDDDGGHDAHATVNERHWVGTVRAKHHVELAPSMSGVIATIEVEEGDMVEAGQRLFRIEGGAVKQTVSQARSSVRSAELSLADAEREAERTRKLAAKGSVGQANLERAEAGVEAAKAGVKTAKAAASVARATASDLVVDAPISGIISAKHMSVGEVATMMPPSIILVIDDLSSVEVRVRVPELKLREIDVGTPMSIYFPALDETREAPVTRIGSAVDPRTRTIELIIELDNPGSRIKAGMSVEVGLAATRPSAASPTADPVEPGEPAEPGPTAMVTKPAESAP